MGFPSVRHLWRELSKSEWDELKAWFVIRGPVGPVREDFYNPWFLLQNQPKGTNSKDVLPPWLRLDSPQRQSPFAYLRPWVGGDDDVNESEE